MKRLLYAILFIGMALLVACEPVSGSPYTYENPTFPSDIEYNTSEKDPSITFDGRLDEAFWDSIEPLTFVSGQDQNQTMSLKAYFGEKGLLIGVDRKDNAIYFSENRTVYQNDSIELYINPTDNKTHINHDFVQFRVSVQNTVESWIGVTSPDGYPWSFYYLKFESAVHIDGTLIDTFAKDTEANRQSEGYQVEVFIPWETLGHESTPQTIDIFPAFVNSYGLGAHDFYWNGYGQVHNNPSGYVTFNHQGPGSIEGSTFGDSVLGVYGTAGFDVTSEDDVVYQTGGFDQFTFFKDIYSTSYGFSVSVHDLEALNSDPYPKVGVLAGQAENRLITFLLDPLPSFSGMYGILVPRTKTSGVWSDWQWNPGIGLPSGFNYADDNKITVLRDEVYFYVFINDTFIVKREHQLNGPSQPGLFTMNMKATYSNIVIHDEGEIEALIASTEPKENEVFEGGTPGFDFDGNNAVQTGGGDQWVYLNDINSEVYGFKVDVSQLSVLNQDNYPKVGVTIGQDGDRILNFFFDPFGSLSNYYGLVVPGRYENGIWVDWQWPAGLVLPSTMSYQDINEIQVLRNATYVYILVNGELVVKMPHGFDGASQPGLFTMNMASTFTDLLVFSNAEVNAMIATIEDPNYTQVFENPTLGFNVENEAAVTQSGAQDQYVYYKDISSTRYLATTTILIGSNLNNDQYPKVGMVAGKSPEGEIAFIFDPRPNKDVLDILAVNRPTGGDWQWPGSIVWLHGLNYADEITMTVVRDGSTMYYFIDTALVYKVDNILLTSASQPGLLTMNHSASYFDSYATTDDASIDAFLSNYKFNQVTDYAFTGEGNFSFSGNDIHINPNSYHVDEVQNLIVSEAITLSGDFYVTYDVTEVTYAPMEWVWPKLSTLLIRDNGHRDFLALGANVQKQNRFETNVGGWLNWHTFDQMDWTEGFNIRIERTIQNSQSYISLYVNDVLWTYGNEQTALISSYVGDYSLGFTFNFASGSIKNITHGSMQ